MGLTLAFLAALAVQEEATVEKLKAKVAELEQKLEASERRFQFEMSVCSGALDGARRAVMTMEMKKDAKSDSGSPGAQRRVAPSK